MDADTVNAIVSLSKQRDTDVSRDIMLQNGATYTYRNQPTECGRQLGEIVTAPQASGLSVTTLTGFRDVLEAVGYEPDRFLVHVENYLTVTLKERFLDCWGRRATYVTAKHTPVDAFRFDTYYDNPQKFIIALQVAFLTTDALLYLIKLASSLKVGNTVHTHDDGISQTVTVKTGEISTAEVNVKPRLKLIPLHTFAEAAPVESEFLLRLQPSPQGLPTIALFDVDGKKWQGELMQSIKRWLTENIDKALPVIA